MSRTTPKYPVTLLASVLLSACAASPPSEDSAPLPPPSSANETFIKLDLRPARWQYRGPYYPEYMRLHSITGQALLAFSVDDAGIPVRMEVVRSDGPDITRAAAWYIGSLRFSVPADWNARQGPERRYLYDVQFVFFGSAKLAVWDPRTNPVIIRGAPIP